MIKERTSWFSPRQRPSYWPLLLFYSFSAQQDSFSRNRTRPSPSQPRTPFHRRQLTLSAKLGRVVSNIKRQSSQATDTLSSDRILSLPTGFCLFRPDSVSSDRMQDIRGVQASLYSYAVPH